jgi:hypothetical protein
MQRGPGVWRDGGAGVAIAAEAAAAAAATPADKDAAAVQSPALVSLPAPRVTGVMLEAAAAAAGGTWRHGGVTPANLWGEYVAQQSVMAQQLSLRCFCGAVSLAATVDDPCLQSDFTEAARRLACAAAPTFVLPEIPLDDVTLCGDDPLFWSMDRFRGPALLLPADVLRGRAGGHGRRRRSAMMCPHCFSLLGTVAHHYDSGPAQPASRATLRLAAGAVDGIAASVRRLMREQAVSTLGPPWARMSSDQPAQPVSMRCSGGCACGAVTWDLYGALSLVEHCHCSVCRRLSGAPFMTWTPVKSTDITWQASDRSGRGAGKGGDAGGGALSGPRVLGALRTSATGVRHVCTTCGSTLARRVSGEPHTTWLAVGSFDEASSQLIPPSLCVTHTCAEDMPVWCTTT